MNSFELENDFKGPVCGLDEAGRGPLAGPVVAACVYIPDDVRKMDFIGGLRDSKTLSETQLRYSNAFIRQHCVFAVTRIEPKEIDAINILQASLKAMAMALREITNVSFVHALVDGNKCPKDLPCPASAIVKGDARSKSIAAASILAKVERDQIMRKLAEQYPYYGWENNVGYPTPAHLDGIDAHGITPHHRKSFAPVANFLQFGETRAQTRLGTQAARQNTR